MDPDVALVAAQARTPPWSQVASPATHIRLFLNTLDSPVLPLFIVLTSFCFSFSSISPTLTCSSACLGSLSVWGHLRSGLGSAMPCLSGVVLGRDHLKPAPTKTCVLTDWCLSQATSLATTPNPTVPVWWLSQAHHERVICLRLTPSQSP